MTNNLPRLELTEDPNKNNEYIIYRYSANGIKPKQLNSTTQKRIHKKKDSTKKRKYSTRKKKSTRKKRTRKSLFNIFS